MKAATRFLHSLAQTLSANALYTPGHPATERSLEHLWQAATALLADDDHPVFLFLGTAPVYDGRPLNDLHDWHHSERLAAIGVQRLEFDASMTLEALGLLVQRLASASASGQLATAVGAPIPGVAFGVVAVQDHEMPDETASPQPAGESGPVFRLDVADELAAMRFVRAEAARGVVALAEVDAVSRILAALVDPGRLTQIALTNQADDYPVLHGLNTALLAMSVADAAGTHAAGRQQIGVAALLHDIGMALLPGELSIKGGLSSAERAIVESHTRLGAELLLSSGVPGTELAAIVAFEHHLRPDGSGYPDRRFDRTPHWASRVVACCTAFVALRSPRPYRAGWPQDRVVRYVEDGAGSVFDPEVAALVTGVVGAVA